MSSEFEDVLREVATLMRQGYHASASQRIPALSEMWVATVQDMLDRKTGGEVALKMDMLVKDFRQAQARADFLRMADLLEYQILPLLQDHL